MASYNGTWLKTANGKLQVLASQLKAKFKNQISFFLWLPYKILHIKNLTEKKGNKFWHDMAITVLQYKLNSQSFQMY